MAKKSWGLHIKMWTEGIVDGDFTQKEILKDFEDKGIKIPESLLNDFDNTIKQKLILKYIK